MDVGTPADHGSGHRGEGGRDWDAYNKDGPFWSVMHGDDLRGMMAAAGFEDSKYFETTVAGVVDREIFPEATSDGEDYGRAALWTMFGAWK